MSLTVKISIKDDKGKEAEIELKETDNLSKLVIIQNVFNLFGIDKDILEQTREFEKIGKAYSNFFEKMEQVAEKSIPNVHNHEEIKEKMIEGLQETEELKEVYKAVDDQPEWVRTGIKIDPDGRKRYRCRYHCVICNYRETHYIFEASTEIKCHSCRMPMPVKAAHPDGFPAQDTHGNFYRAGEYQDWKLN
jgi:hypothetical protein